MTWIRITAIEIRSLFALVCLSFGLDAAGQSPADALSALTQNDSFEAGTHGWNGDNSVVSIVDRMFVPDPAVPSNADLGLRFAELSVLGSFSQWTVIDSSKPYHIVAIQASKSGFDWAGFGVTYLDGFGYVVGVDQQEILPQDPDLAPAEGLIPYSFGTLVPEAAVVAVIWIYNGGDETRTYFDEFGLYQYTRPDDRTVMVEGFDLAAVTSTPAALSGTEFYRPSFFGSELGISADVFSRPSLKGGPLSIAPVIKVGQADVETAAWQPLRLVPGVTYRLVYEFLNGGSGTVVIGFDFFGSDGNEFDEVLTVVPRGSPNPLFSLPSLEFTVPAGTNSSTFWIYTTPTDLPVLFPILRLEVVSPTG